MLKEYEIKAIRILLADFFSPEQIDKVLQNSELVGYEYTGSGYFLSIKHFSLPINRIVFARPTVIGKTEDGIVCGFVIFVENRKLTIECHSWGELNITEDFRDKNVEILETDI